MKDQNRESNSARKSKQMQMIFFEEAKGYDGFLSGFVRKFNQKHFMTF